jgi:phenylalanyl-tRNA synthetase alpha chain
MKAETDSIRHEIENFDINNAESLEQFRLRFISKKGTVANLFAKMGSLDASERGAFGKIVNDIKNLAQDRFDSAKSNIDGNTVNTRSAKDDITLPGAPQSVGSLHPLSLTLEEIKSVFFRLGFSIAQGPEIEDDFHNFTALNFPPEHPARDMQDTFYVRKDAERIDKDLLLRTHTSPVQIRKMLEQRPPIRSIMPGRVYRNESVTYKSYFLFHQVEALYVDKNVNFAELKETLVMLAEMVFNRKVTYRLRPSFFPFTEPSLEMDIWWEQPGKPGKWLEILGAGMVHPNVLKSVDIDPEVYSGFALGMGVERIAKLRYEVDDIRTFYDNDIRFLQQFQ